MWQNNTITQLMSTNTHSCSSWRSQQVICSLSLSLQDFFHTSRLPDPNVRENRFWQSPYGKIDFFFLQTHAGCSLFSCTEPKTRSVTTTWDNNCSQKHSNSSALFYSEDTFLYLLFKADINYQHYTLENLNLILQTPSHPNPMTFENMETSFQGA